MITLNTVKCTYKRKTSVCTQIHIITCMSMGAHVGNPVQNSPCEKTNTCAHDRRNHIAFTLNVH